MNRFINLLLLVVMSFSIAHGVVLDDAYEENHCSVQEYITEFSSLVHHDKIHDNDVCDSHHIFHVPFLLPDTFSLFEIHQEDFVLHIEPFSNPYAYQGNTFRPPIT